MRGQPQDPGNAGAPPGRARTAASDGAESPFWADARRIARASHAGRSRHPMARGSRPATPGVVQPDAAADPVEEFSRAMGEYRERSGRMFPTWCEVLEVLRSLGYSRLGPPWEGDGR